MSNRSPMRYRAAVLVEPGRLEMREMAVGELGQAEALVRVHAAGVCGTDLAIHDGAYRVPLPLVLGHEWVGRVERVGDERDVALVGKRVVGEINHHCIAMRRRSACAACRAGLPTHCSERTVTGIIGRSGAFAEFMLVATDNLRVVPDEMPDEAAVFVEPLAAALQTFSMSPLEEGQTVVVLGCGRLGVLIALVARALGGRVHAFTRNGEHVGLAARVGVEARCVSSDAEVAEDVREATGGLGADIVVEASGSPETLALALECVRPRGTVALKSTPGLPVERFDLTRAVVDEVRLQGSRCGRFDEAIGFWRRQRPPLERLIEAEFPLHQIAQAIERAHRPGKVLVRCAGRGD